MNIADHVVEGHEDLFPGDVGLVRQALQGSHSKRKLGLKSKMPVKWETVLMHYLQGDITAQDVRNYHASMYGTPTLAIRKLQDVLLPTYTSSVVTLDVLKHEQPRLAPYASKSVRKEFAKELRLTCNWLKQHKSTTRSWLIEEILRDDRDGDELAQILVQGDKTALLCVAQTKHAQAAVEHWVEHRPFAVWPEKYYSDEFHQAMARHVDIMDRSLAPLVRKRSSYLPRIMVGASHRCYPNGWVKLIKNLPGLATDNPYILDEDSEETAKEACLAIDTVLHEVPREAWIRRLEAIISQAEHAAEILDGKPQNWWDEKVTKSDSLRIINHALTIAIYWADKLGVTLVPQNARLKRSLAEIQMRIRSQRLAEVEKRAAEAAAQNDKRLKQMRERLAVMNRQFAEDAKAQQLRQEDWAKSMEELHQASSELRERTKELARMQAKRDAEAQKDAERAYS